MHGLDVGMAAATLQIMCDWERHLLKEEKKKHPVDVAHAEALARQQPLGKLAYRKVKSGGKTGSGDMAHSLNTLSNGLELAANIQLLSGGDGGGSGGDGGGGGGDGGGC